MSDVSRVSLIERAECPECGRARTEYDAPGTCQGVYDVAEHEPQGWVLVEYVPRSELRGAVDALDRLEPMLAEIVERFAGWADTGIMDEALAVVRSARGGQS